MTSVRRQILDDERNLLRALAKYEPQYRTRYLQHIEEVSQVEDWNDGSHSITIVSGPHHRRVEAAACDEDGSQISILLFGAKEAICMLEILRSDGRPLKRYPEPGDLTDIWDYKGNPRPEGWE
jgi:hypothetical protein